MICLNLHFIGNKPEDIEFKNIIVLDPLEGKNLANELKQHDIYITASEMSLQVITIWKEHYVAYQLCT